MTRQHDAKRGRCVFSFFAVGLVWVLAAGAHAQQADGKVSTAESVYPRPGRYSLAKIQKMPDLTLLNGSARAEQLAEVTTGAVTLLAFFYGACRDPTGCPVAWATFEAVRAEMLEDATLKGKIRLVFISLDPKNDRPATMKMFESGYLATNAIVPWRFLTARSETELTPFLDAMGQTISFERDASGNETRVINHVLKVYLLDPGGWVREIYATAFLIPEVVMNDIRTLILEHPQTEGAVQEP